MTRRTDDDRAAQKAQAPEGPRSTEGDEQLSLWKVPGFSAVMVAVMAAFGAWSLLLPTVPTAVIDSGGSEALAGLSTGIFMAATVCTQLVTPRLLRNPGYRPVMVGSAFMLGVPALGHLLGTDAWVVLLFSALRGIGFGALTVAEAAVVAELVPLRYLGKATGVMGIFVGLSQMVFLPVGISVSNVFGYHVTYLVAAVVGLFGAVMSLRLPAIRAERTADAPGEHIRVPMWKLVLVPALALTTLSMSYGVVSSFLPVSVRELDPHTGAQLGAFTLSLVGGSTMVFRYLAGISADRLGAGKLFIPGQLMGFVGMALVAAALHFEWSVWIVLIGALLFGGGFGIIQNESLLSLFARLPRGKVSEASATWNIFYDGGTGLGSVILASLVAGYGYAGAYGAGAVIIVAGIAMTSLDLLLGRHRVAEVNNIRTRLSHLRKA